MSAAVHRARRACAYADTRLQEVLRRDYPLGHSIAWVTKFNGPVARGVVVMHCHGDRIKVRNRDTGKELFINSWRITLSDGSKARAAGRR